MRTATNNKHVYVQIDRISCWMAKQVSMFKHGTGMFFSQRLQQ